MIPLSSSSLSFSLHQWRNRKEIMQERWQLNDNCQQQLHTQRRKITFQRYNKNNKFCIVVLLLLLCTIVISVDFIWIRCNPLVVTSLLLPTTEAYTIIHNPIFSFSNRNTKKTQYHYHNEYSNQKQQQQQQQQYQDRYHTYPTATATSTSTAVFSSIQRNWFSYTPNPFKIFQQIRKQNFVSFVQQRRKNSTLSLLITNNLPTTTTTTTTTSLSLERQQQQQEDTECNNNNLSVASTLISSTSKLQIDTNIIHNETSIVNDDVFVASSSSLATDDDETLQGKQQLPDNDEQQSQSISPNRKRKKIAIIFNTNARAVRNDMIQGATDVFMEYNNNNINTNSIDGYVYATSTDDELQNVITTIVSNIQDYDLIIPVGGDGTVSAIIQLLCEQIQIAYNYSNIEQSIQHLPYFAYIPMGTGNGLGSVVSCELKSSISFIQKIYTTFLQKRYKKIQQLQNILRRIISVVEDNQNQDNNNGENQQQQRQDQEDCTFPHDRVYEILEMPMINVIANSYKHDDNDNSKTATTLASSSLSTTTVVSSSSSLITSTNINTKYNAMSTTNNYLCFFAGIGFDSLMLNDYKSIKQWSSQSKIVLLKNTLSSVLGYCVALIIKTLPAAILYGKHQIKCIVYTTTSTTTSSSTTTTTTTNNEPIDTCWWVDHRRGDFVRPVTDITSSIASSSSISSLLPSSSSLIQSSSTVPISKSVLLYNGTMGILAAGTTPYYGGGLRLFPFARITHDKMHVRIGRIHPAIGFMNIPKIFAGSYRDTSSNDFGCLDFIGTNFNVIVLSSINNNDDSNSNNKDSDNNESNGVDSQLKQSISPEPQQGSGYPFQHSGESVGLVNQFQLRVTKDKIKFLCLSPRRPNKG